MLSRRAAALLTLLLAPGAASAGGPTPGELAKLGRCKELCRLVVPRVRSDAPADAYVARALPVRARVDTGDFSLEVPQGWAFTISLTPGGGKIASIIITPSGDPGDRTAISITGLAGGPVPTLEGLAKLDAPSATESGRTFEATRNEQQWFIKEYSAKMGGVDERCWLAYAARSGVTYAVAARATLEHTREVGTTLGTLIVATAAPARSRRGAPRRR